MKSRTRKIRKLADGLGIPYLESTTGKYINYLIEKNRTSERHSQMSASLKEMIERHGGTIRCMELDNDEWNYLNFLISNGAEIPNG